MAGQQVLQLKRHCCMGWGMLIRIQSQLQQKALNVIGQVEGISQTKGPLFTGQAQRFMGQ
jgi:hypothetical protein